MSSSDPLSKTGQYMAVVARCDEHRDAISKGKARISERLREWSDADRERRKRALVVDDDEAVARTVARSLASEFEVVVFLKSADAIVELRASSYDLVVTDLNMPGMTGMELIGALRASSMRPLVPVLVLSGAADEASVADLARRAGASAALAKPFEVGELQRIARELVGDRTRG